MRFGSVCSGIEAASVAWGPIGWQAAWFSEIEPFPCAVLAHHYPDVLNHGDMTTLPDRILSGEVEAPDLFCGGTPCQAFSVAGLRRSLDDARGNLSLTFCEIADAIDHVRLAGGKPASIVFWENVPGVLNTADNAFGCFLGALAGCDTAIEPLAATGWTDAGVVAGPVRTVCWRVLDAQFFGLAQRRRRVFVVASARDGFDPAQVLLEWEGVRRDSAPSREAGKGVARGAAPSPASGELVGTIGCNTGPRGHGFGDFLNNQAVDAGHLLAFGGNRTSGARDVASALSAHGGTGRHDFETETFITHALRGEGFDASEDGTGRGTPLVPVHRDLAPTLTSNYGKQPDSSDTNAGPMLIPMAVPDVAGTMKACKDSGGWSNSADHAAAGYMVPMAHAFDARQSDVIQYGDKTGPLDTDGHSVGVLAFSSKDHGADATADLAPTLRAMNHADSHANGGGQMAVAVVSPVRYGNHQQDTLHHESGIMSTLPGGSNDNAGHYTNTVTAMQVRRLTPRECERLQGFPDDYTLIPWRGKPASECPDGPRYKALGNSWAVPVVRWIGQRIQSN